MFIPSNTIRRKKRRKSSIYVRRYASSKYLEKIERERFLISRIFTSSVTTRLRGRRWSINERCPNYRFPSSNSIKLTSIITLAEVGGKFYRRGARDSTSEREREKGRDRLYLRSVFEQLAGVHRTICHRDCSSLQ